jgi:hypothetical protein
LPDGPLGIELRSDVCTTDQVHRNSGSAQRRLELPTGLLACAKDDAVDLESAGLAGFEDVQAAIIHTEILDARDHLNPLHFERRAVDPTGRLAEACSRLARLTLQQKDLA